MNIFLILQKLKQGNFRIHLIRLYTEFIKKYQNHCFWFSILMNAIVLFIYLFISEQKILREKHYQNNERGIFYMKWYWYIYVYRFRNVFFFCPCTFTILRSVYQPIMILVVEFNLLLI